MNVLNRIQCLCEEHYYKYQFTYCHDLFLERKKFKYVKNVNNVFDIHELFFARGIGHDSK